MDHWANDNLKKGSEVSETVGLLVDFDTFLQATVPKVLIPIPASDSCDKNSLRFIINLILFVFGFLNVHILSTKYNILSIFETDLVTNIKTYEK